MYKIVTSSLQATSKRLRRLDLASKSPLFTLFQETREQNGLLTIRAAGVESHFRTANTLLLSRSQKPFYMTKLSFTWLTSVIGLMTALINSAIIILAVVTRRSTNAGLLAVGLTQAVSLQDVINLLLVSWTQLEISAVAVERNMEYSALAPEEDQQPESGGTYLSEDWPPRGDLRLASVTARYAADLAPALDGISFQVPAGTKVGICGRTGSGKRSSQIQSSFGEHHKLIF